MKKSDIKKLRKAEKQVQKAIDLLSAVYDNVQRWQAYRVRQEVDALVDNRSSIANLAHCMEDDPEYQHKDWR